MRSDRQTNRMQFSVDGLDIEKVQHKWQILFVTTAEGCEHRHWPVSRQFRPMSTQLHQQSTRVENCHCAIHLERHTTNDD